MVTRLRIATFNLENLDDQPRQKPTLDQRKALMLRKAQKSVGKRNDSFLVDLQASKTCRRDIHANSISTGG